MRKNALDKHGARSAARFEHHGHSFNMMHTSTQRQPAKTTATLNVIKEPPAYTHYLLQGLSGLD